MITKLVIELGVGAIAILAFLTYMGAWREAWREVKITECEEGPFFFVYREVKGTNQREIGIVTTELQGKLTSVGVTGMSPFDIFHPPTDRLPNEIGFVVPEVELTKLSRIQGFSHKTIPRQRFMTTQFPFRNRLSFMVGYMKVDPALKAYREQKSYGPALAIARNDGDMITYLQPTLQQSRGWYIR
jgi:hypothetical protein